MELLHMSTYSLVEKLNIAFGYQHFQFSNLSKKSMENYTLMHVRDNHSLIYIGEEQTFFLSRTQAHFLQLILLHSTEIELICFEILH